MHLSYGIGDIVPLEATFYTEDGTPAHPGASTLEVQRGDGTSYSASTSHETIDGVPVVRANVEATGHGIWQYRFVGTGTNQGEVPGAFEVIRSFPHLLVTPGKVLAALGKASDDTTRDWMGVTRAASEAVVSYARRDFKIAPAVATERRFHYYGEGMTEIDDVQSANIDSVVLDGATIEHPAWHLGPENEAVGWYLDLPRIDYRHRLGDPMGFESNRDRWPWQTAQISHVYVTAKWGWPHIPDDVVQATLWTAAAFADEAKPFTSESIAEYSVSYRTPINEGIPRRAMNLLDEYRRF